MKFKVVIIEDVEPKNDFVIVYFQGDEAKQHFQIKVWEFNIKFRAEEFEEPKTKLKSYFTHFDCDKINPVNEMPGKH